MIRILPLMLLLCLTSTITNAQRVETLVKGPSTFDDGLAIDSNGNIYAARYYGSTITKITPSGETEIFSTGFGSPNAIAFDNDGNLLVPNATSNKVHRVSKDGSKKAIISNIFNPAGVAVDSVGNIYVSQYQLSKISKLDTAGTLTTFLTGGLLSGPVGMVFDESGDLFIGNFDDGRILKYSNDSLSIVGDIPGWLGSFALKDSIIFAAGFQQNKIYKIKKDGSSQSVFSGTGIRGGKDGTLMEATFDAPNGIAASHTGDTLYVTDFETRSLRMITGLIPNNPIVRMPDTLDFGNVNLDVDVANKKILTIKNVGNDTLRISKFEFADSTFKSLVQEINIPPYSADSIEVFFTPYVTGDVTSNIKIFSNSASELNVVTLSAVVSSSTSSHQEKELPAEIKLYQNYPNPFNPSTNISFELPESSNISMRVFDIQGREVALLIDGKILSGFHNISFDGSNLASGIYYCKIDSKGYSETIRMTLIK